MPDKNQIKFFKKLTLIILLVVGVWFFAAPVYAAAPLDLGLQPLEATGLGHADIRIIIANIIKVALGLLGILAVGLMLYAGYEWMTAGGNEEQIGTAKKILVNATIGLVIMLSAYSIVSFVMTKLVEATTGVGANGAPCANPDQVQKSCGCQLPAYDCNQNQYLHIKIKPSDGSVCIKNYYPVIVFNKAIDLNTVEVNGAQNIFIHKFGDNSPALLGHWNYQGADNKEIYFKPTGSCGTDPGSDCFDPSTDYVLDFKNTDSVLGADGSKLSCDTTLGTGFLGCDSIKFTTGANYDNDTPTVNITYPTDGASLKAGDTIPVSIAWHDNGGLQNIDLNVDGNNITSVVPSPANNHCQTSSTNIVNWPSTGYGFGNHTISAIAMDYSNKQGTDSVAVKLKPEHCFNNQLDPGLGEKKSYPPSIGDCGGECGACEGDYCAANTDCASDYCDLTINKCVNKMRITGVDPLSGAVGDYVSIFGQYFGTSTPGHVYFTGPTTTVVVAASSTCKFQTSKVCVVDGDCDLKKVNDGVSGYSVDPVQSGHLGVCVGWSTGENSTNYIAFRALPTANNDVLPCDNTKYCYDQWSVSGTTISGQIADWAAQMFPSTQGAMGFWCKPFSEIATVTSTCVAQTKSVSANPWVEAPVVNCSAGFNNWIDNQIIVSVPTGTVTSGPIMVVTASTTGQDGVVRKFTDLTNDNWGANLADFVLSTTSHPGICNLSPNSGMAGTNVQISGKGFGNLSNYNSAVDSVSVGGKKTVLQNSTSWSENSIFASIPSGLGDGDFAVQVTKNNLVSNGVKFTMSGQDLTLPIITGLSTTTVAKRDYLTIYGKNFGTQKGSLFFKSSIASSGTIGDTDFPQICSKNLWSDSQILIKVPSSLSFNNYTLQVQRVSDSATSTWDQNFSVSVTSGPPAPGICDISPSAGPVPFAAGASPMVITGDGFMDQSNVSLGNVWFWQNNSVSNSTTGRVMATDIVASLSNVNTITLRPPSTTQTGPVIFYAPNTGLGGDKISNGKNFTVYDCTKNNNTCPNDGSGFSQQCCSAGSQTGQCISSGQVCKGLKRSSGYAWLFSTGPIPEIPHVLEQCGGAFPVSSPSPSTQWPSPYGSEDANITCLTSVVNVQFSASLDSTTVNSSTVKLFTCDNGDCTNATPVSNYNLNFDTTGSNPLLTLKLPGTIPRWTTSTWYQVRLYKTIASDNKLDASGNLIKLAVTKPCVPGDNTAYCFKFHTGAEDCKIKKAVIIPLNYWTDKLEEPIDYRGNAESTQYCVMINPALFDWHWGVASTTYADFVGASTTYSPSDPNVRIKTIANTVGVGLANDAVNVNATAKDNVNNLDYAASSSPLKIDLSNPQVVDYWPKCLEACTNADVGVKFNISMSAKNVGTDITHSVARLWKCGNENCTGNTQVSVSNFNFDQNNTILYFYNFSHDDSLLVPDQLYQVEVSSDSDSAAQLWSLSSLTKGLTNINNYSKPYKQLFTWRFRTKKEKCVVDHVVVSPGVFTAQKLDDRAIFSAVPYSSPDACSATGQSLNPWENNWSWLSSSTSVATVSTTAIKGFNPNCTSNCLLKGSDIQFVTNTLNYPVCGNGKVEAGEDCDPPLVTTTAGNYCTLNCLFKNKTNTGSSANPDPTSSTASICGNGMKGANEDCDLGIAASSTVSSSSMLCNAKCLHMGTRLAAAWCDNTASTTASGYSSSSVNIACGTSFSQCGDGLTSADEDPGCETGVFGVINTSTCNERCLKKVSDKCSVANTPGCTDDGQLEGSSLAYPVPSVCGDGQEGAGEYSICESTTNTISIGKNFVSPWALAIGQGGGLVNNSVFPPVQSTIIRATAIAVNSKSGDGIYQVQCGYKTDAECVAKYNNTSYGVGDDSCCYPRAVVSSTYPADSAANVCPNTYIEADFDKVINPDTLVGNLILAKYDASSTCATGTEQLDSSLISLLENNQSLAWYQKIWHKLVAVVKNLFGIKTANADVWCSGADLGSSEVVPLYDASSTVVGSKIVLNLIQPLRTSTDYAVVLKPGIKDLNGVSIAIDSSTSKPVNFKFTTGKNICTLSSVSISPANYYFSVPNSTTTLEADAFTDGVDKQIQSIPGFYSWNFIWGPMTNPYVQLTSTTASINLVTANNLNGELDVSASANIIDNKYPDKNGKLQTGIVGTGRSHIIVFLCENPWPPRQQFPYRDIFGNNDNFNFASDTFDNQPIPAASVGDGYFNFASYYCADNGASGNTADDLPFLRPAVQADVSILGTGIVTSSVFYVNEVSTTYKTVVVSSTGYCENNNQACLVDNDCAYKTLTIWGNTFVVDKPGMCYSKTGGSNNYYFNNGTPLLCNNVGDPTECMASSTFVQFAATHPGGNCQTLTGFTFAQVKPTCLNNTTTTVQTINNTISVPSTTSKLVSAPADPLKRFIFTNNKNSDAIGIQVLPNAKHLSAKDWFSLTSVSGGKGFSGVENLQTKPIDGYDAVSDGHNIYVNALNFVPSSTTALNNGKLYTNTYLFSINADASDDTIKVFDQLIKNLRFNYNISNFGFCGSSNDFTTYDQPCLSDFDCQNGQVCAAKKTKLQRNFQRLQAMQTIDLLLQKYYSGHNFTYPALKSGTYLSGQSVSTWPSWTNPLGNDLIGLPVDPINKLGPAGTCKLASSTYCLVDTDCPGDTCLLHTPETGWSTDDMRFSFACNTSSLAYRYMVTSTPSSTGATYYTVKLGWENVGLEVENLPALFNSYVPPSDHYQFDLQNDFGICTANEEISTLNKGKCGDGQINWAQGEQCDPPGSKKYNKDNCTKAVNANSSTPMGVQTCTNQCVWVDTASTTCGAAKITTCGNGIIEIGEDCDDGALNGKYGQCGKNCKYDASASSCGDGTVDPVNEVCDTKYDPTGQATGICNGGFGGIKNGLPCNTTSNGLDSLNCNYQEFANFNYQSSNGVCITSDLNKTKYGLSKATSCDASCQKFGPYCGDGIVQKEFGEECESNTSCSIGSQTGKVLCGTDCRYHNTAAVLDYKFDDVVAFTQPTGVTSYILNSATSSYSGAGMMPLSPLNVPAHCYGDAAHDCPVPTSSANNLLKQAMQFNGNSNFFKVDNNPQLNNFNEITIAAWVNIASSSSGISTILSKSGIAGAHLGLGYDYGLFIFNNGSQITNLSFDSVDDDGVTSFLGRSHAFAGYNNSTNTLFLSGSWHFVAVTVDSNRQHKYYVDGNLISNGDYTSAGDMFGAVGNIPNHDYPVLIGKQFSDSGFVPIFFKGSMDEVQLYSRALLPAEIQNLGQLQTADIFCQIPLPASVVKNTSTSTPDCGNGKIQPELGEMCDASSTASGVNLNGIPCTTAGYNKSCTYCSADCKNVVTISATGFCGDGILNGPEKCEQYNGNLFLSTTTKGTGIQGYGKSTYGTIDPFSKGYQVNACTEDLNVTTNVSSTYWYNDLFANQNMSSWSNYLTTKIGKKSCTDNCGVGSTDIGLVDTCVSCGLSAGGVTVSGTLINVLDPDSHNPLLASSDTNKKGDMGLLYKRSFVNAQGAVVSVDKMSVAVFSYDALLTGFNYRLSPSYDSLSVDALINSSPMCSINTDPTNQSYYSLAINADTSEQHAINLPVVSNPTPDAYNLLLSPVIERTYFEPSTTVRQYDVRIVVSWVGDNPSRFVSGFLVPTDPDFPSDLYGTGLTRSNGIEYFNTSTKLNTGIWYHGLGARNTSNEEAYTIDTSNMITTNTAYAFYVKDNIADNGIEADGKNYNLKVDVYVPEIKHSGEVDDLYRHFAQPEYTFYFSGPKSHTLYSPVAKASYWHVFNIIDTAVGANAFASFGNIVTSTNNGSNMTSTLDSVRTNINLQYY